MGFIKPKIVIGTMTIIPEGKKRGPVKYITPCYHCIMLLSFIPDILKRESKIDDLAGSLNDIFLTTNPAN